MNVTWKIFKLAKLSALAFFLGGVALAGNTASVCKDTKKQSHDPSTIAPLKESYCNILFWPNQNLGFGHVALEAFKDAKKSKEPDIYLSFAMGNQAWVDMEKHQMEPERIRLPNMPRENFEKFEKWFNNSTYFYGWNGKTYNDAYGEDYSLLSHNCAHAVLKAAKEFGYKIDRSGHFALRPKQVRDSAKKFLKK